MGSFVSAVSPVIPEAVLLEPSNNFSRGDATPASGAWSLVSGRFSESSGIASALLTKLEDYMDNLSSVIVDFPSTGIDNILYDNVLIGNDVTTSVEPRPVFSGTIDLDFGTFDTPPPSLVPLPTVDLSSLIPGELPADITAAISWFETAYDDTLYSAILARLLADLSSGTGGLGGTIEQDIFDRELARLAIEENKIQTEIEEYFSSSGFDLPTGALAARLQEHANGRAMRMLDANQKIAIDQADLAQKNNQFVISASREFEALLRDYSSKKNDRSLDYQKAVAGHALARYAEYLRGYLAVIEGNKAYIQVQIENLRAAVETNKALFEAYSIEAQAYGITVEAKSKANKAITDVYSADVSGYEAESKAISENQKNIIAAYDLKMRDADNELKAAIASATTAIQGYNTEYALRAEVAKALTNAANQSFASAYGAVNASAGLSSSSGVTFGESVSHQESKSHTSHVSVSASAQMSIGNTLNESHGYTEK